MLEKHLAKAGCKNQSCEYQGWPDGTSFSLSLTQKVTPVHISHKWLVQGSVALQDRKDFGAQLKAGRTCGHNCIFGGRMASSRIYWIRSSSVETLH